MDTVIKIIGIGIVILGVAYFAEPGIMKRLMAFFKQGERIYLAGVLRLVLGIVFLISARECAIRWVIIMLSIIFITGSSVIFMLGPAKFQGMISWAERQPSWILRIMAAVTAVVGGIIIYAA
jgi:uncharacterized membrane protein